MNNTQGKTFHPLAPGKALEGDWCNFKIPENMQVGENTVIDSSASFKQYYSKLPLGLKLGSNITLSGPALATEESGYIEIGDYTYIMNASIACNHFISIGKYVFIASGVTIVDSDFHPANPAGRVADTIALSPVGNKKHRPSFTSKPVIIEDEVWIGFNAAILKGVRIGKGAIIQPGSVVLADVEPGQTVMGNPAKVVNNDK
jgi:acetyltransferase-like isoleucine patch superfamily enzyme